MRTIAALLLCSGVAFADEVHLKNGNVLRGVVKEQGNKVVVQLDMGSITLDRSQVKEIVRTTTPLQEFHDKLKELKYGDVEGYFKLALWARERDLPVKAREMFDKVLAIDPDHEGARKHLGYRRHRDRWMTEDEYMVAIGFVKHRGDWLKRETVEKLVAEEELLKRERSAQATLERIAEMEAEIERMRISAQIERDRMLAESIPSTTIRVITPMIGHYHYVNGVRRTCCCPYPGAAPTLNKKK